MSNKIWLKKIGILIPLFFCSAAFGQDASLWEQYKSNFITKDGRVIDYYQNQISHSEGQGYGMRLALTYNDKATFDKIWRWTNYNLKVRSDNLFAWQWGKRPNGVWGAIDHNNATDGDILIAYSLIKAFEKWQDAGYKNEAITIIADVRKSLTINWHGRLFLLPSYYGFVQDSAIILNPSYFIFSAFRYFAKEDDKAFWEKIYSDALFLIGQSCFGKLCLPPDWIMLTDAKISVFADKSPYFGIESVRIMLNLSSENQPQFPKGVEKILEMYKQIGYLPFNIDLEKDSFSLKDAPAGYYAIFALAAKKTGNDALSKRLLKEAREKLYAEKNNYYSFSLYLMATSEDII